MNKFVVILLLCFARFSFAQEVDFKNLVGKWKGYKKELRNGDDGSNYTKDGKPYKFDLEIDYYENGTGKEYMTGQSFSYLFSGDTLLVGNRLYKVDELSSTKLVTTSIDKYLPNNPLDMRTYFEKIE